MGGLCAAEGVGVWGGSAAGGQQDRVAGRHEGRRVRKETGARAMEGPPRTKIIEDAPPQPK
jgi:hypothetical protein